MKEHNVLGTKNNYDVVQSLLGKKFDSLILEVQKKRKNREITFYLKTDKKYN
jgi:hypothetical protein